ncbi:GntR family transcriptional regulator [Salipaludibacillus aurantiacus]|uniref:GntR family transcriptional regulator n=1 Tax=Salipaludibacillus aurantiacus TaxID=1601833 RepID=A0A1H9RSC6_9BACI|nr:GntR family transcriptional regulator [Salipaludibacillus aurantiacus]SER75033.1 GntR family transcriptional regulator [Salipaludibacillus aurantiacus]
MFFHIDTKSNAPLYEQIIQQVKEMCAKGLLTPDERLPSVRELSSHMVINPNTVSKAYQELERQGIIVTVRGRGTFISKKTDRTSDPGRLKAIRESLKEAVIENYYAGYSKKELIKLLEEVYEEMEGKTDEN